jgi:hypothetical protein
MKTQIYFIKTKGANNGTVKSTAESIQPAKEN